MTRLMHRIFLYFLSKKGEVANKNSAFLDLQKLTKKSCPSTTIIMIQVGTVIKNKFPFKMKPIFLVLEI